MRRPRPSMVSATRADALSRAAIWKAKLAGAVQFALPGFANINAPELQEVLARYIARVREIDAASRAASREEE